MRWPEVQRCHFLVGEATFWDDIRRRLFLGEDGDDGDFFVSKLLKGAF